MKLALALLSGLLALVAVTILWFTSRRAAEEPSEAALPGPVALSETAGESGDFRAPVPETPEEVLKGLGPTVKRLEALEREVRELRTELRLASREPARAEVPDFPRDSDSKLGDRDLSNVRQLSHEELVAEAWIAREKELLQMVQTLGKKLALKAEQLDPLADTLARGVKPLFLLERQWLESNLDSRVATNLAPKFRQARADLSRKLNFFLKDDDLAIRAFLYVVSDGSDTAFSMDRNEIYQVQKSWLR
jgi:hypothetical protein